MKIQDPFDKPQSEFDELIDRLSSPDSSVGIDVKFTHAVIIDYLRQISFRLEAIQQRLDAADQT